MANNRLQLKCVCGAERYLAKRFGMVYSVWVDGAGYLAKLDEFFEEHADCDGGRPDHFSLSYEQKPNSI